MHVAEQALAPHVTVASWHVCCDASVFRHVIWHGPVEHATFEALHAWSPLHATVHS
jgi:hypothetical protein